MVWRRITGTKRRWAVTARSIGLNLCTVRVSVPGLVENVDTQGSGRGIKVQTPASPNIKNDHRVFPLRAPKRRR